jgi:MFS family permease
MPMLVSPLAGMLSDRVGRRLVMSTGLLLQCVALASFGLLAVNGAAHLHLALALLVAGIGLSMVLPTAPTAALSAVYPMDLGKAAGVNGTVQRFGSAFGIAMVTAILAAHGNATTSNFEASLQSALEATAVLALLGAVSAFLIGVGPPTALETHPAQETPLAVSR